ncbi:MAG: ABC transporter substrate-binding protein [Rubrivivax sp.]|jgi:ABC-type branched-subunit amino acid transport system substrate-binding protein|nr:ABC transporter substrate-binding protein [Rubrivivax sp.]
MRLVLTSTALALAASLAPLSASAQAPSCTHNVGMVVSLTGAAGRFGQAASKSVELAFGELNKAAGAQGIAGCRLAFEVRDAQSQGAVAVDQARQLVDLKKVPAIIGGIISSVSIPVVTSVTAPAGVVQISPASTSPTLTRLANEGTTKGWFFRTITSDALQGTAAAKYAMDQGMRTLTIIHVNNDFGVNMLAEFRKAYEALGGKILSVTPYNAQQPSYAAEVTNALKSDPPALYFIGYPGDGTTIVRTWIQQGGPQRFLLNDGMNAADFIKGVGPQFLNNAFGTSSGTTRTPSTEFFASAYPAMSGGFDAGAPAADRAFDAGAILGLAIAQAGKFDAASIRDAIRKVTDPGGEVVHAGPQGFARALQLIREKKPVRYVGVIGPVQFDRNGDIVGPFRTWKITNGEVTTVGQMSMEDVQAVQARLPR